MSGGSVVTDATYDRREFLKLAGVGTTLAVSSSPAAAPNAARSEGSRSADLCDLEGRELATLIRRRRVSAREVMDAHLARIHRVNPKVNAIVAMLDDERCRALADAADRQLSRGEAVAPHSEPPRTMVHCCSSTATR
jgi:hypothetical protein